MKTDTLITAKERFSAVMSACSVLSAVLVVWIHAYNIEVYSNVSNMLVYWLEQVVSQGLARGAVPFFFFSSAFFLYSKPKTVTEVYQSRMKSIVFPYVLWNAVYTIIFAVLYHLSISKDGMSSITVVGILESLFLHRYNYAFWFMLYLIVYVACYPIIRWVISRNQAVAWIGLGVSLVLCWCGVDVLERFVYYYVGALVGFYYRQKAESIALMEQKKKALCLAVTFLMAAVLFWLVNVQEIGVLMRVRDLAMMLLLFFLVLCCNVSIPKSFAALSFMIYALHPFVLEAVEKCFYVLFPHRGIWMLVDYIVAPIICLLIIFVVCLLWKKVLPSVYKVFNGGRV